MEEGEHKKAILMLSFDGINTLPSLLDLTAPASS